MHRATAAAERFVEPTPKRHRAKESGHGTGMLTASTIETALKLDPSRCLIVVGRL